MAINYRSDMTRPLTLGLIGLAVLSRLITFLFSSTEPRTSAITDARSE